MVTWQGLWQIGILGAGAIALAGCGGDDADPVENDAAAFDQSRRMEIAIEMNPADWEVLREQGRTITDLFNLSEKYEYDYFDATISVDGRRYERVQVRKKGFLGSLSSVRPSFKVDFDRVVKGQSYLGLKSLTLNNDRQDPSHTHQCMSYDMFARADVPAPRCSLAHVVVNGEDLGTYSNVEAISKHFLSRHFADNDGNLYEGQAADFMSSSVDRLELKTNETENDRSDAHALAAALDVDDSEFVSALSAQLDLDEFRTFWAMEVLLGHWDSYSGNTNNYYAYRDRRTQRFAFIPWGTDGAFQSVNPFDLVNQDVTVFAAGRIANRLYKLPDQRELYRARLGELNDTLWNVDRMLADVSRVQGLAPDATADALDAQRSYVRTHSDAVRVALTQPAKDWQDGSGLLTSPCLGKSSSVTGHFNMTFGDLNALLPGDASLELSVDGKSLSATWLSSAGITPDDPANPRIRFAALLESGSMLVVDFQLPLSRFVTGHHLFHGLETAGTVFSISPSQTFTLVGFVGDGAIDLTEASATPQGTVVGTVQGELVQFGCAEP